MCASLVLHALLCLAILRQGGYGVASMRAVAPGADPDSAFGLADGVGDAPHELAADRPLQAPWAPHEQALLSRDPAGPGRIGDLPTMNLIPPGRPAPAPRDHPPPQPQAIASSDELSGVGLPAQLPNLAPRPAAPASPTERPGGDAPAADPAPLTESESDAFSKGGDVEIVQGAVHANLGRAVKTVRPRLSWASQVDVFQSANRQMLLRVRLQTDGKPALVEILKSISGNVDQDVKLAVYQWEFGPRTRPLRPGQPDVTEFTITFR